MIIPSIDIMDGKAVQLRQGKEKVLEEENVEQLARKFNRYGEVAVIDLNAAMGKGSNIKLIKKLCQIADCRVGGGIRSVEKANEILAAGAKKIIIGTKAEPEFLKKLPKSRTIVAIDTKDETVVTEGWTNDTRIGPIQKIETVQNYCSEFLYTDVEKEGMLEGIRIKRIKQIIEATTNDITIAGGISSIDEIKKLENMGTNMQIGMAIYTGKIDLTEAFISLLNFGRRNDEFIPTVVQDTHGQVLMVASSNKDSVREAFKKGLGTYYSRSRQELWTKGMTSGNTQDLIAVRYDCDRDTLLFKVDQTNVACHTGSYSCFGEQEFNLKTLYDVIKDRIDNPDPDSYTSKISSDEVMIKQKIQEEVNEVLNYDTNENLVWELADLTYFLITLMAKKGINIEDVKNELWRRRG